MKDSTGIAQDPALGELVRNLLPGAYIVDVRPFGVDKAGAGDGTTKGIGYGQPLRVQVRDATGAERTLVFHTAKADRFGHDRRSDRACEMLLGFDDFPKIPRHVAALDVGAIRRDGGGFVSLRGTDEFYLVTSYAPGRPYADDLRRIARAAELQPVDRTRVDTLVSSLVELHAVRYAEGQRYTRAIRDLLGSGEGVFGIIDGYPANVPGAPAERLQQIERRCLEWRWRLSGRTDRLRRTHGDFHPFNVLFDDAGELHLLDASRGCAGDPADDVTCLAINYVFFALEAPGSWQAAFRELWYRFWQGYLAQSSDRGLLEVAAPFLAWRGLVVANPAWYPNVAEAPRDRMLGFVERVLDAPRFDPADVEDVFA